MMSTLPADRIRTELEPYGISASDELCDAISAYIELLLKWNAKISLTTVTDPVEILRFHFAESLLGAVRAGISHGRLADVGTGAGFPGIPLRMHSPQIDLVLIESNLKKVAFLAEVIRVLKLDRVEILRERMEDLPVSHADFDVATARALGRYETLLGWARNRLSRDGRVALWLGQDDATSLSAIGSWNWSRPISIPQSDCRVILEGRPRRS